MLTQLKFNPRELQAAALLLAAVGLLAADLFLVTPLISVWRQLDIQIERCASDIGRRRQLLAQENEIRAEFAKHFAVKPKSANRAVARKITDVLRGLEKTAKQDGLRITDIKPQALQSGRNDPTVFMSVEAGWESLMRFLYDLHQSSQMLTLTQATLQRKGESSTVSAQFVITAAEP